MPGSHRWPKIITRRRSGRPTSIFWLRGWVLRISSNRRRFALMPASFDYAIVRVVPRVERQEFINAGVIVFCLEKRYLDARIHLDTARLQALWPEADADLVRE